MVETRQPTYRLAVSNYAIKIDSNAPLVVATQSDVTIKLNAGPHSAKFYVTSSDPSQSEKVTYGQSSTKDIVITKDQELKLKYTGPYLYLASGSIEEMQ